MEWQETFLGSRRRQAGTAIGAILLLVVLLFVAGVFGVPSVTGIENTFGEVNQSTTVVVSDITVENPNPFGISLGGISIDYTVMLNGIEFGVGEKNGLGLSQGVNTVTLRTHLDNSKIPPWWVSHIRNDEVSTLQVRADVSTGFGYSTTEQPVNRTIETDILGAFNTTQNQPVNANAPAIEDPVAVIRQRNATFGQVSQSETPIEVTFIVYNRKDVPIVVSELAYNMTMNDVNVGAGVTNETYVIEPKSTERVTTTIRLQTQRLDEWWVTHLKNNQTTRVFIDFSARISVEGLLDTRVPLEGVDYETFFKTNIFGGTNSTDGSDGPSSTTQADDRSTTEDGDATTTTTDSGEATTTTEEETTTEDDGLLALERVGAFIKTPS